MRGGAGRARGCLVRFSVACGDGCGCGWECVEADGEGKGRGERCAAGGYAYYGEDKMQKR